MESCKTDDDRTFNDRTVKVSVDEVSEPVSVVPVLRMDLSCCCRCSFV